MRTKVRLGQVRHPQTDGERDCVFSEDWRRSSISNEKSAERPPKPVFYLIIIIIKAGLKIKQTPSEL